MVFSHLVLVVHQVAIQGVAALGIGGTSGCYSRCFCTVPSVLLYLNACLTVGVTSSLSLFPP